MKIIFMGRKKYSAELLEWSLSHDIKIEAVVTDSHFPNSPTAKKSKDLGIPVISMEEAETIVSKPNHDVDLVVSYLYWEKINTELINGPKYGCINFHPAILPDWRGTAGYNVAILNKLNEWGGTAHYINEKIDTGNIIKTYKFNFDYRIETAQSLEKKTQQILMELYKSVLLDVKEKGTLDSINQNEKEGTYISRNQMEKMKQIDFEKDDIDLKIRAFWFPPYDGAYIVKNNKRYTLINSKILSQLADENSTFNA